MGSPGNPKTLAKAWQPGQSGNPKGRPIGSRNQLSEAFIAGFCADFLEHGAEVIAKVRKDQPAIYLRVIARLIPREMHIKSESVLTGMSDDNLTAVLGRVTRELAARTPTGVDLGATPAGSDKKLN